MRPYLYLSGLEKLAKKLRGDEVIHIGIRPYGFHAGNVLSLVVYPLLLCRQIQKNKKEVKFKFKISINDEEQKFVQDIHKSTTPNDWVIRKAKDETTYGKIAAMVTEYSRYFEKEAKEYGLSVFSMDEEFDRQLVVIENHFNYS